MSNGGSAAATCDVKRREARHHREGQRGHEIRVHHDERDAEHVRGVQRDLAAHFPALDESLEQVLAPSLAADHDVFGRQVRGDRQPAFPQRMAGAQQTGKAMARQPALPEVSSARAREVAGGHIDVAVLQSRGQIACPAPGRFSPGIAARGREDARESTAGTPSPRCRRVPARSAACSSRDRTAPL